MRIISGNYRGRKLLALDNDATRPTTDRVKENVFNLVQFDIEDKKILDLFSGSGSLGLECVSRGAKYVILNDNNAEAIEIIKKNAKNMTGEYKIVRNDYRELLSSLKDENFDLIFVDAPYKMEIEDEILKAVATNNIIAVNGKIVYEHDREFAINNENFEIIKEKKYGKTIITIFVRLK